jgi:cell pole-organizing protein PopZ
MPETIEPEPSMDEILASIRRIIADDGDAATAKPPVEEPPLLLTERVDPIPSEAETAMTDDPEPEPETEASPDSEWIGEAAAVQASSAFDKLAALHPSPPAEPIAMPPPGRSLEDVTRDILRPMLKAWLDENLPRIVQDRVDEEVERLSRRRVR